jgi:hypothetical protein
MNSKNIMVGILAVSIGFLFGAVVLINRKISKPKPKPHQWPFQRQPPPLSHYRRRRLCDRIMRDVRQRKARGEW